MIVTHNEQKVITNTNGNDTPLIEAPATEGIKYTGSKLKLMPYILGLAKQIGAKSVFDGFSGSTRVSQAFSKCGFQVVSNDIAVWSKTFAECYLLNRKPPNEYIELIDHLNAVKPIEGWFSKYYGGQCLSDSFNNGIQSDGSKKPWQLKNTRKLDGIRSEIDRLNLDEISKSVALTSLILALDKVDSTMGHFVSYLKDWSPRSFNDLKLTVPTVWQNNSQNEVFSGDIFDVVENVDTDLAYFDPPYGSNNEKMPPSRVRYASYYHLWTTVILNDEPELFGKSFRRQDSSDKIAKSVFDDYRKNDEGRFLVVEAIEKLIQKTPCRWIILSYSSGGRATAEDLHQVISSNGKLVRTVEIDYKKNVMSSMKWTNEWLRDVDLPHREFLFLIEKS